jgi:glycosyltransferase involved in cell wall biosynthesis
MISVIHPTRSRPDKSFHTTGKWLKKAGVPCELIVSVDSSDPELDRYRQYYEQSGVYHDHPVKLIVSDNSNAVQATNEGAKVSLGDILIVISDDFECFEGWGKAIIDAMADRKNVVLKTYDGVQNWIVTLPIMDREYYETRRYVYYPPFFHMFCDTELTHHAELEGKLIMRNDIVFKHSHYSTGETPKDELNERNDKTWNQGMAVYLYRVRERFGLPEGTDVLNLCYEATPHKQWLRKALQS